MAQAEAEVRCLTPSIGGETVTFKANSGNFTLQINKDITVKEFLEFLSKTCSTPVDSLTELEEKYVDDPESTRVRNLFMAYMQKFQLTQAILCKYIGVSQSVLSQWTRGKYNGANLTVTEKVRQFIDTHQDGPGQMPPQEPKKKKMVSVALPAAAGSTGSAPPPSQGSMS